MFSLRLKMINTKLASILQNEWDYVAGHSPKWIVRRPMLPVRCDLTGQWLWFDKAYYDSSNFRLIETPNGIFIRTAKTWRSMSAHLTELLKNA